MFRFIARRQQTQTSAETPEQPTGTRKRRTLEDLYRLIDDNLAILD